MTLLYPPGDEAWRVLTEAFRHRDHGKEAVLAEFIRSCVRNGPGVLTRHLEPEVKESWRRARAVR